MPYPTFRAFELEQDLTSFVTCLNSVAASKGELRGFTEETQREQAEMLNEAEMLTRCFVAEVEGKIIGFADIWKGSQTPRAALTLGVHPEWQRQGVGQTLLSHAQQQARGLGATALLAYAHPEDETRAFYTKHNFMPVSGFRSRKAELTLLEKPQWSEGFKVLSYAHVNDPIVHTEASNKGWGDLWGHQIASKKATAAILKAYQHEGILLLFTKGEAIGVCKVQEVDADGDTSTGVIDAPGIAPEYRSEENYRNLLLEALHWLYKRGCTRAVLESWGELDMALSAYESLGFTLDEHELGYALPL